MSLPAQGTSLPQPHMGPQSHCLSPNAGAGGTSHSTLTVRDPQSVDLSFISNTLCRLQCHVSLQDSSSIFLGACWFINALKPHMFAPWTYCLGACERSSSLSNRRLLLTPIDLSQRTHSLWSVLALGLLLVNRVFAYNTLFKSTLLPLMRAPQNNAPCWYAQLS